MICHITMCPSQMGNCYSAVSPGLASKLQYKWDGPFRVTEKVTPVTYQLKHVVTGKNVKAQRLRKFHQRQQNNEERIMMKRMTTLTG